MNSGTLPSRWDWWRAGLIACILGFQVLDALPLPELKPHHLNNPVARRELEQWAATFGQVGWDTEPEALAELGLRVGGMATAFRRAFLKPWHPVRRLTGTGQAWSLFAYPEPATGRLVVEGQGPEGVVQFYRAPDGGGDVLEAVLEYRRVRGVYDDAGDRPQPRKTYRQFGLWMAARLMSEHAELDWVEVRLDRHLVRTPDEGPPVPDLRRHALRFSRADLDQDGSLERWR